MLIRYFLLVNALLAPVSAIASPVSLGRGINVLGYDPLWKGTAPKFTFADFDRIRDAGFNNVRINVRPFTEIMGPDNSLSPKWVTVMKGFVDAGLRSGLTVIIDYHDTDNRCSNNFEACLPKLQAFWKQIAIYYRSYPNNLVFEILNEPHYPLTSDDWNAAQQDILSTIRATNPKRTVIISPTGYSSIVNLKYLKVPKDRNIITTVHYYEPREFTMQFKVDSGKTEQNFFKIWGTKAELTKLNADFDRAKIWSSTNNVPIFLGEFGVWDTVPSGSRATYLRAVVSAAEQRGFSWANWQYQYDFRATEPDTALWLAPIVQALIPSRARVR